MDKLEIKHLAPYLPYKLECYGMGECTIESEVTDDEKPQLFKIEGMNNTWVEVSGRLETVTYEIHIEDCIPHLIPLSALIEPLPDGSVPIVELAKMASNESDWMLVEDGTYAIKNICADTLYIFDFLRHSMCFSYEMWSESECLVPDKKCNQLQLFEYLFANHFDVYGLIDVKLAIDKRTI